MNQESAGALGGPGSRPEQIYAKQDLKAVGES